MENILIKVEDVKKGDHILIGGNHLQYLIVQRDIKLSKKPNWRGEPCYSKVLCSKKVVTKTRTYITSTGGTRNYTYKEIEASSNDHNTIFYADLNDRAIWLVKREREGVL